jgi:hydroxyacylglutathione hydrolase
MASNWSQWDRRSCRRSSSNLPRLAALLLSLAAVATAQTPPVREGTLPEKWITGGPRCIEVPDWQVHQYNEDFFILRESGCTHYEKPFLYLLFGKDKALLEDTGAGKSDASRVVAEVIAKWCALNKRESIPLIVAHSHAHGDHIAGDAGFRTLPNTTMVPLTVEGTAAFYGIEKWPEGSGRIDLGERVLDVVAIPGHQPLSVAFYDRQTGVLLTGDTLYPGRLYVSDFPAFAASIQRLVDFTRGKPVAHVLGTHIEQSAAPFVDYPVGTKYQPNEHPLALTRGTLLELNDALQAMQVKPTRLALRDITIWPR